MAFSGQWSFSAMSNMEPMTPNPALTGPIQHASTDGVPPPQRFDYWSNVLSKALLPMRLTSDNVADFHASVSTVPLGPLQMVRSQGNAHDTIRNRRDVERTETRIYHLMVSVGDPWTFTHRGQKRLLQGDLVLSDSQFEHEINIRSDFDILNLKMPVPWIRTWVPDPDALVGRHIAKGSSWGQVLSPILSQLLPEYIADSPLRPELLTEHIGAMLALVAGEYA